MTKLFKTVDQRFKDLGFVKVVDDQYVVVYERPCPRYTHVLALVHKAKGLPLIQSYDKNLFDEEKIGNTCVGLTYLETKLALKKMRKKGWHRNEK